MKRHTARVLMTSALVGAGLILPQASRAHCDTMNGPVVQAAKTALEKKDVTPVLKWVKPDAEAEIKTAFAKTLAVRAKGAEARELADQFFFETLVRVHRAGEGAPFTGLKPAGTPLEPAIEGADKALESGDIEPIVRHLTSEVAGGIRHRFTEARQKKAQAEHNVEAGRAFVAAYVEYVHYVEALHETAAGSASGHEPAEPSAQSAGEGHTHKQ